MSGSVKFPGDGLIASRTLAASGRCAPECHFMAHQRVTFAVCHGHNPGIVIDLANSKYDKVVLTVDNAEEIAARLSVPSS
jgi:hypothetical protein